MPFDLNGRELMSWGKSGSRENHFEDYQKECVLEQPIMVDQAMGYSSVEASVVVPCYNEEDTIGYCLEALIDQDCDFPYEIIVVDDGSTDRTVEYAVAFLEKAALGGVSLRVVKAGKGGPARARNIGLRHSRGKYVIFVDADCEANSNWISIMVKEASKECVVGVGGPYMTKNSMSKVADYVSLELEYRHLRMMSNRVDFVRSANACFHKDVLMEIGGFDEDFTSANAEDSDLCFKILRRGYRLNFSAKAWVRHRHPSTIRHYLRQQFSRGVWRVLLYLKNPEWMKGDSYAGLETLAQPAVLLATFLGTALTTMLNLTLAAPLIFFMGLVTLIALNSKFLVWIFKVRRSISFLALCLCMLLLRSFAWTFGGVLGAVKFFPRVFMKWWS